MLLLFLTSFLAATVIPFSSEAHFAALVDNDNFITVLIIATAGNTLGGLSSYYLGWLAKWNWIEKYLKVKRDKVQNFQEVIQKYGGWMGFLCWLPVVGDIIAVALGIFRAPISIVAPTMLIGKAIRYFFVGWLII